MADDMTEDMNRAMEFNRRRFAEDRREIDALYGELLSTIELARKQLWVAVEEIDYGPGRDRVLQVIRSLPHMDAT